MHYRTPRIDFLDTAEDFLGRIPSVQRCATTFELGQLLDDDGAVAVVPAAP
jgi:hypothetical protein